MSVQAIDWAFSVRTSKATSKCVLIALANRANEDGICWPSQKRIAHETEMSVDSVQRRLRELESDGLIARQRRNGQGGQRISDLYKLRMKPEPQGAALDGPNRNEYEPEPQLCGLDIDEPSKEPSLKQLRPERRLGRKATKGSKRLKRNHANRSPCSDRGAFEVQIAGRIGPNGFDVLLALSDTQVDHLCVRQRRGTLDDETIARLRTDVSP